MGSDSDYDVVDSTLATKAMYRITLHVIIVCILSAVCVQDLVGQSPERERRSRRSGSGPPPAVQPTEGQPADEQATDEEAPSSFVPPPPPLNSLVRFAHPSVAGRLGLSDEQRAEVTRIIALQTNELSNLPRNPSAEQHEDVKKQYEETYKRNEDKLMNILTATQRAVLDKGLDEKMVRLVFRHQPWKDVLQYLADQAGYQLVMDAPPPATFNYTDQEERTITQALDLVNGVLVTKGFTLVRNDRMLMLLDLSRPIPNRSFPQVKPEELGGRGSYEFVAVTWSLERRNRESVKQGIATLSGPYTRVFDMPDNSLLVVDIVEFQHAVQNIVNGVTNPPIPVTPPKPEPPPPPEWKTYTIEKNDPSKIELVFKRFVPSAEILRLENSNSRELHIKAQPDEHTQLEAILKMLEADSGSEQSSQSVLKTYSISQYLESAQSLAQDWRMERFRRRAEGMQSPGLSGTAPPGVDPNVWAQSQGQGFWQFSRAQLLGQEVIAVLKQTFPNAVISDNPVAEKIVVLASPTDQEKINEFFESLRPSKENQPTVQLYRYTEQGKKMNEATRQQLQALVPNALLTLDAEQGQILVVAPEKDQEILAKAVSELEAAMLPSQDKVLQAYRLSSTSLSPFSLMIGQLAIQDKLRGYYQLRDVQRNQVLIWATEKQHELIQKVYQEVTGQSQQTNDVAPVADAVVLVSPKNIDLTTLKTVVEDVYPAAKITEDTQRNQLIIRVRPEQKESLQSLLKDLDADDPDKEKRYFKPYPIESGFYSLKSNWSPYTPVQVVADLQKLAPKASISFDIQSQQLIVWGTEEEHAIIEAAVRHLIGDGKEKKIMRIPLHRNPGFSIVSVLYRMFPTVRVSSDYTDQTGSSALIIEGHPKLLPKVAELIELLDPKEPSDSDPIVTFYKLESVPSTTMLAGLKRLAPGASLIPDGGNRQIMVIAKPAEQKIIERNLKEIATSFAPEEPVLCIYPVTREERERLSAFILQIAATELRGAKIVPERDTTADPSIQGGTLSNQISIWAKPSEHEVIAAVLKQMQESQANVPTRQLKSFPMSVGDLTTAQSILRASHPDAMLFPDEQDNRLMVWATAEELEKVTKTLTVQGSIDDRQMLAYPAAGLQPAIMKALIKDVFQGLKITEDVQTRKILVWASPEEHVRIAEMVEEANKEFEPDSELAEKFVAYSTANLDVLLVSGLFRQLIPDADVHVTPGSEKIVVRARAREHERINELFEQLREKDEAMRPQLKVYPFGEIDPVMVEAMLRNQLPDARSMSPDSLVERLGWSFYLERYYERHPYYRNMMAQVKKIGYFSVDPQTQSVHVFTTGEQHEIIGEAMKQLVAVGNQEGLKPILRRYTLDEVRDFYDVHQLVQKIAPSAMLQAIWDLTLTSSGNWRWLPPREFFAYTNENEHEKIEALVREMNDKAGVGRKEMLSITLPEKSPYSREKFIETIQNVFPDITPMPGGTANQILVWAPKHKLEQIQKIVDDVCTPLPEGERTTLVAYPLQYISVEEATAWLTALYPNVSFDPAKMAAAVQAARATGRSLDDISLNRARYQRPNDAKFIVVVATPLEHVEIAKTITELDQDLPDAYKMVPRTYSLNDMPLLTFYPLYGALHRAFPNTVITPSSERMSLMVVATEDEHKKVSDFIKAFREDNERQRPALQIYALKRQHYYRISTLVQRVAPGALIFPGSKPDQIAVWGTPKEQLDISEALAKLETAADAAVQQGLQFYKTGMGKAYIAADWLRYQFPGTLAYAMNPNEICVWASPVDHETIATMLQTTADAFPDPVLKPYYFTHVLLDEGAGILQQAFAGQATLTPRPSTGDLLVFASPDVHEKIATSIAEFDVPRPAETESLPKAYDVSDLPSWLYWYVASQIQTALQNRVQVLPSTVSGQLVVTGRPADQEKVGAIIKQILGELPAATTETRVYTVHRGSAANIIPTITAIAPNAQLRQGTNPSQLVVLAKESDHRKIKETIDKMNESDANVTLKPYYFKHVPLNEGYYILYYAFMGSASLTPRFSTGDLLVFASPDVHEKIAASIAEFDVPRPAETEAQPVAYDLSDLPAGTFGQAASQILVALQYRIQVMASAVPGQLIVWGKRAEQEKVKAMIDQMLSERPAVTATMQAYTLQRVSVANAASLIRSIAPNAESYTGTLPNQILVRAKESDHLKIRDSIDALNAADPDMTLATYSTKNVTLYGIYGAITVLNALIQRQNLNVEIYPDTYTRQLIVWANPEDQKKIADVLERYRSEDRDAAFFTLEHADPYTVQTALYILFVDEPYAARPWTDIDPNTNVLFVQGTQTQLARVRKMLREMGENVREPSQPEEDMQQTPAPDPSPGNIRVLQLRGGSTELLRELEKVWRQSQPNQLRIIRESETPLYSLEDEVQRETASPQTIPAPPQEENGSTLAELLPSADPIYIIVSEDDSLMISSVDTVALDRLESYLKRLNDGIVYEGRDFTIFSVRNISATVVANRLRYIMQLQMAGRQPTRTSTLSSPIPLSIQEDMAANTIMVRGSRADRQEVAKLIALLDVSELPGERIVRKPISVPIQNTQASRIRDQVMRVYQQKISMTQLPGGVVPQIIVDSLKNSLEIIAPEPLASELKEYAEEIDRKMLEEPGRKIHVIPLHVKSAVIERALQQTLPFVVGMPMQPYVGGMVMPYGGVPMQPYPYGGGTMGGGVMTPAGVMRRTVP